MTIRKKVAGLGKSKVYTVRGKKFKTKASAMKYAKKVGAGRIKVTTFDTSISSMRR